jgi:hypothetical protein
METLLANMLCLVAQVEVCEIEAEVVDVQILAHSLMRAS